MDIHKAALKNDDPGVADFKVDGKIISDGNLKSELLTDHFSRVYTAEDLTNIPTIGIDPKPSIDALIVTVPGVIKQLQSLKPHKASRPDEIPPWLLKEYAVEIGPMLADIYQSSVDTPGCAACIRKATNQILQTIDLSL